MENELRPLSRRTRKDLTAAVNQVIRLACDGGDRSWPVGRLQASLTRDGDHSVIDHLSALAAKAILARSQCSGASPRTVAESCYAAMSLESLPFAPAAWPRARALALHRLDDKPLRITGDPIEAVDLAGGLALLHVLALLQLYKAEADAKRTTARGKK